MIKYITPISSNSKKWNNQKHKILSCPPYDQTDSDTLQIYQILKSVILSRDILNSLCCVDIAIIKKEQ